MSIRITKLFAVLGIVAASWVSIQNASACDRVRPFGYFGYYQPVAAIATPTLTVAVAPTAAPVVVQRAAIVEVAAVKRTDPEVTSGATLGLAANFLGSDLGFVLVKLDNNVTVRADVKQWSPTNVVIKLPELGVTSPVGARIDVILPNGNLAKSTKVRLMPQADLVVIQEPTALESTPTATAKSSSGPSNFSNVGLSLTPEASLAPAPAPAPAAAATASR